jgi:hypothetical protein
MRKNIYLLQDEFPMVILPELAVRIGLEEAIVLQQINYWIKNHEMSQNQAVYRDGRYWVYNTVEEWQAKNFRWWSVPTVKRILLSLEEMQLVESAKFGKTNQKWYTINQEGVEAIGYIGQEAWRLTKDDRIKLICSRIDRIKLHQSPDQIDLVTGSNCTSPLYIQETRAETKQETNLSADAGQASNLDASLGESRTQLNLDSGASLEIQDPAQEQTFSYSSESKSKIKAENITDLGVGRVSPPPQTKLTQNTSKPKRNKRTPEEVAAGKAAKEAERRAAAEARRLAKEEKERLRQEQVDRDNQWRYDIFGSKERYKSFTTWFYAVLLKDNTTLTNKSLYYVRVLENLSLGGEKYRHLLEEFKMYESSQKQAVAAQQPTLEAPVMQKEEIVLFEAETFLKDSALRLWQESALRDKLREECIREVVRLKGNTSMQYNVIWSFKVRQENADYLARNLTP